MAQLGGDCADDENSLMEEPLHLAIAAGDLGKVRALLDAGTRPSIQDRDGGVSHITPLHTAAKAGSTEIAGLLIDAGAHFSWDSAGWSPIHYAVNYGDPAMAAFLLDRGGPLVDPTDYGDTPLHIAADKKSREAVVILLDHARAIDNQPGRAGLPLYNAANEQLVEAATSLGTVRALLDWQCLSDGQTALHRALEPGFDFTTLKVRPVDPELVVLLVQRGADLALRSKAGERPLDIALRRGYVELLELLGG